MDEAFQGLTSIRKIVDDVIVYDENKPQHVQHVREILRRCEDKGISLNRDKFQFCQTEARFAGLKLTQHGYSISDAAIAKFPTPSTRRGQLASSLSTVLAPLRQFKERGLQLTMRQAKHALNPTKDTCLHTDASRRIAEN